LASLGAYYLQPDRIGAGAGAAYGGLRWDELVGLRRDHVDLVAGTVTVAEQLMDVNGTFSVGRREAGRGPPSTLGRPGAVAVGCAGGYNCDTVRTRTDVWRPHRVGERGRGGGGGIGAA
jgi:hypothetical protein